MNSSCSTSVKDSTGRIDNGIGLEEYRKQESKFFHVFGGVFHDRMYHFSEFKTLFGQSASGLIRSRTSRVQRGSVILFDQRHELSSALKCFTVESNFDTIEILRIKGLTF